MFLFCFCWKYKKTYHHILWNIWNTAYFNHSFSSHLVSKSKLGGDCCTVSAVILPPHVRCCQLKSHYSALAVEQTPGPHPAWQLLVLSFKTLKLFISDRCFSSFSHRHTHTHTPLPKRTPKQLLHRALWDRCIIKLHHRVSQVSLKVCVKCDGSRGRKTGGISQLAAAAL